MGFYCNPFERIFFFVLLFVLDVSALDFPAFHWDGKPGSFKDDLFCDEPVWKKCIFGQFGIKS